MNGMAGLPLSNKIAKNVRRKKEVENLESK
jgi:hypothetical protein